MAKTEAGVSTLTTQAVPRWSTTSQVELFTVVAAVEVRVVMEAKVVKAVADTTKLPTKKVQRLTHMQLVSIVTPELVQLGGSGIKVDILIKMRSPQLVTELMP
jgi:hypothetical protein